MAKFKKITIAFLSVAVLASLLYPGVTGLMEMSEYSPSEPVEYVDGRYVDTVRSGFETSIPVRNDAISFWSMLKYRLFREGSPGVLIGRDNWLFTTEEYDEKLIRDVDYESFFARVEEINNFFTDEGLKLAVVLVPSKSRIYEENIKRFSLPQSIEDRYDDALNQLGSRGILTVDLRESLQESLSVADPYYRYDTHWTFSGTSTAATAISEALEPVIRERSLENRSYFITEKEEKTFSGDLLAYVPALKASVSREEKLEAFVELKMEDANPPSLGLFDDPEIPVILVGTSYSFDPRWNFDKALKLALQLDVLNMAEEGQGPFPPMEELMESGYFRETGSSIILWEIPERYIPLRQ